jgi:predicted RNA-binding Zn ribbon-like protein
MTGLPAWYPDADEAKAAPTPLLLVQAFLNTEDHETGIDLLGDADHAEPWLRAAGLLAGGAHVEPAELELARAVRSGIGALVAGAGEDPDAGSLASLRRLAEAHRPRLTIDDHGMLAVENARHDDLADGLFGLLLIVRAAQEDGSWERLRACANPDCRWVFYDRSRNQQGSWCDMAVCGNRLKNRRLRARRRLLGETVQPWRLT